MTNESETDFSGVKANDSRPETIVIINCALNAPLMLISVISNPLVLAAILRTPSLRSPSILLLCRLAASDLILVLFLYSRFTLPQVPKNGAGRRKSEEN